MTASSKLVAIVLTFNEEAHLPDCLASLRYLTERVMVLDSGSIDRTGAIATASGATLVTRTFDGYASQRNAALDLAEGSEWVLFLDADERLTRAGADEIREAIRTAGPDVAAFWLPRLNVFFGRIIRGGGWWPDEQARLLRRGRARYDPSRQVHEIVAIDGQSLTLREPMIHLNYASWREFIRKQRLYTRRRVEQSSEATPRRRAYVGAPVRELWRRFVRLKGYRDGLTGLFLAGVLAFEEVRAVRLLRSRGHASE
jgi:glycosyltransferase involved in cell wall biosynthesis